MEGRNQNKDLGREAAGRLASFGRTNPLLRHRSCDTGKCFCSDFRVSFFAALKPSVITMSILASAIYIRRMFRYDFCRHKRRQAFQPQARPLTVWMPVFIWLDCLRVWRQAYNFHRRGVFYCDSGAVSVVKLHKEIFCFHCLLIAFFHNLPPHPHSYSTGICEVGAWRVSNDQIPGQFQQFQSVHLQMPLRMPAGRLDDIAGIRLVPQRPERLADLLRFLAGH